MRKILTNKKGVTLLEGLIALMLLALVATGTFSVLLSSSRKSTTPDIREEMILAVEKATQQLNLYSYEGEQPTGLDSKKMCNVENPTENGSHDIACLLPPICDRANSKFVYIVEDGPTPAAENLKDADCLESNCTGAGGSHKKVNFTITCNGYSL